MPVILNQTRNQFIDPISNEDLAAAVKAASSTKQWFPYTIIVGDLTTSQNDEIQESVKLVSVSMTTDLTTQVTLEVQDPGLKMHNAGYFVIRRPVQYGDLALEVATVNVRVSSNDTEMVEVYCRTAAIQKMKRAKGKANFGKISPTEFAKNQATASGLGFFGSSSPAKAAIVRTLDENKAESTWDVLSRLAGEQNFTLFESGGILYFATEEDMVKRQTDFTLTWPANPSDPLYMFDLDLQRSDDEDMGATLDASIAREAGVTIRPGMVVKLEGIDYFDEKMMVTDVEYDAAAFDDGLGDAISDPVTIRARTPEETKDVKESSSSSSSSSSWSSYSGPPPPPEEEVTKTYSVYPLRRGDRGPNVKTLQKELNSIGYSTGGTDGIFGPKTEAAVKSFQKSKRLPVTGVYDRATAIALKNATPPTSSTKNQPL